MVAVMRALVVGFLYISLPGHSLVFAARKDPNNREVF